jgi:nucleoside-diphosphate-sugar epimerase
MRTVLVTGAAGCVGHHAAAHLLASGWRVRALVRDPSKLRLSPSAALEVRVADVQEAHRHADVDAIVHLATAWGDPIAYRVNVDATLALARLGTPMVYFCTASILDVDGQWLPAAEHVGTDYIISKSLAWRGIRALPGSRHVSTLFPTLIVGGEGPYPASHLGRTLAHAGRLARFLRPFTLDATFQLIHARDLARMVGLLLDRGPAGEDLVAGNQPITAGAAIAQLCALHGLAPPARPRDLTWLGPLVSRLAGGRMSSWDRWCLTQRHFGYQGAVNPRLRGLEPGLETLAAMHAHEGWGRVGRAF